MARSMFDGGGVPLFFWGQDYLGTLTSMWACIAAWLLFIDVGPLVLRIGRRVGEGRMTFGRGRANTTKERRLEACAPWSWLRYGSGADDAGSRHSARST
jgi:hypothetical protein